MTENLLQYFKSAPGFTYYELLKEIYIHPAFKEIKLKTRKAMEAKYPDAYLRTDQLLAAKKAGVAIGMEWLGGYESEWARKVYLMRKEKNREITRQEEKAIRREVWEEYLRVQPNRHVSKLFPISEEDSLYAAYLLADLKWPRHPADGSLEFEFRKLRLRYGMQRAILEKMKPPVEPQLDGREYL